MESEKLALVRLTPSIFHTLCATLMRGQTLKTVYGVMAGLPPPPHPVSPSDPPVQQCSVHCEGSVLLLLVLYDENENVTAVSPGRVSQTVSLLAM